MATETRIHLECPQCRHRWHAATMLEGENLKEVVNAVYCVRCHRQPPLLVAGLDHRGVATQMELFP